MGNASYQINRLPSELKLVYIIGTYPGISTTFIDREICTLRRWGVNLQVVSVRRYAGQLSAEQIELRQGVIYLLPISWSSFLASHLWFLFRHPTKYFGVLFYLVSRPHPTIKSRIKTCLHFAEGVYAAYRLRSYPLDHVHAHFADRAAILALVVGHLLDLPYSLTAHANDIYVNPVLLPEKISEARFVVTCTGYNQVFLSNLGNGQFDDKIKRIYHGLDAHRYRSDTPAKPTRPVVLSVGQLKEKKGFTYLLKACRRLKELGFEIDCQIVGEGPMRGALEAEIRELSLQDTVTLLGVLPHDKVIELYHRATIFVLPSVLGGDGDRDGIPNVILEAMASGLPVISTRHSGIPEVIEDGVNGLLVSPADENSLVTAIVRLLDDPEERHRLGQKGCQTVEENFDIERNVKRLLDEFMSLRMLPSS